jgi:hypothetical protein
MPEVKLDVTDAAELAEMLQFLSQWLDRDPARLAASLEDFVGHPAYGITQLHQDLERFVFLLGGSDGEPLFGPRSVARATSALRLRLEPGHRPEARRGDRRRLGAETQRDYPQGLGADHHRLAGERWRLRPRIWCLGTQQPGTPLPPELSLHRHQIHDGLPARPTGTGSGRGQRPLLGRDHRRYPRRGSAAILPGQLVSDRSQPGDRRGRHRRPRHGNRRRFTRQPGAPRSRNP